MNRNYSGNQSEPAEDTNEQNQNVIKGSQRSDGTFRKDIKIREGFINMFDAEKYRIPQRRGDSEKQSEDQKPSRPAQGYSMRNEEEQKQNWRNSNSNHGGSGYQNKSNQNNNNQSVVTIDNQIGSGISRQSNNNRQVLDKASYRQKEGDFPDLIGKSSSNKTNHILNVNQESTNKQQVGIAVNEEKVHQSKQDNNNNNNNNEVKSNQVQYISSDKQQGKQTEDNSRNVTKTNETNKQQSANHFTNIIVQISTVNKDKEMKKLSKKLREIEQLEQKHEKGMELQPEALEKVSKKDEIIKMLERLSIDE